MKTKKLHLVIMLALFMLPFGAEAQHEIQSSVLGAGGGSMSNSTHKLSGTTGQAVTGIATSPANIASSGFWSQNVILVTGVERLPGENIEKQLQLYQNYPNPFNPSTTIRFDLPKTSSVKLRVYDILGKEVVTLLDEELQAGVHKVIFDASVLSTGIFFYRLEAEGFIQTMKFAVIK